MFTPALHHSWDMVWVREGAVRWCTSLRCVYGASTCNLDDESQLVPSRHEKARPAIPGLVLSSCLCQRHPLALCKLCRGACQNSRMHKHTKQGNDIPHHG